MSPEAFAVDFEQFCLCEHARTNRVRPGSTFAGLSWAVEDFFENGQYWAPEVMTVDEWFERINVGAAL
jgi:hypothetical protein